ncbi:Cation/acetate symporter ActP [Mycolicibacterium vanbaalenii]|uniref:Cation/acetate symporter ActP n=1 Tax=Mycolicibacterium vanbaalenii TaxID=110539 RepID=A0A5S9PMJ4_MYCVN|nr:Cation/acetate symporter ActP [Mycolicibacterium vanbaalenii]
MSSTGIVLFLSLIGITLGITFWAGRRNKSVDDHLVAGGRIGGRQNGLAIVGDAVSASTFLGTIGAIALSGFNYVFLAAFAPIAFVLAMLLVAEPLRNLGRFTLADVAAVRFAGRPIRTALATGTASISVLYIVAQYVAGGLLVKLLFGIDYWASILIITVLTSLYALVGGMLAATWIQIVKAIMLLTCVSLLILLLLPKFGWSLLQVFSSASEIDEGALVEPIRSGVVESIDQISLSVGLIFGVIGLPHVLIRYLTVKDAQTARTSAITCVWVVSALLMTFPVIAYAAAALLGAESIQEPSAAGNLAVPLLAKLLGGDALLAFVSAVAVSTILASLAGMVIATTGAVAHDIYGQVIKSGIASPHTELLVARLTVLATGAIATAIALTARDQNIAVLASLAIALAACSNFPALMFTIYARRVTAAGLTSGLLAGLLSAVVMIGLSPTVHGAGAPIPLVNPAIVALPLAVAAVILVSRLTRPTGRAAELADEAFEAMRYQAVTGSAPRHQSDIRPDPEQRRDVEGAAK